MSVCVCVCVCVCVFTCMCGIVYKCISASHVCFLTSSLLVYIWRALDNQPSYTHRDITYLRRVPVLHDESATGPQRLGWDGGRKGERMWCMPPSVSRLGNGAHSLSPTNTNFCTLYTCMCEAVKPLFIADMSSN